MSLHVEGQVVAPTEAPIAVRTLERLLARVFPVVTRQLVAAREPPRATFPRALVGLFPRMGPLMRLQMRALRVHLRTADVVALVHALARVIDGRAPHSQSVVGLRCWKVSQRMRVNHAQSQIVLLRVRNVRTSDQH